MKLFRGFFLLTFFLGIGVLTFLLVQEQVHTPFGPTLSPLFQELGKPLKSVDRVISRLYPVNEIDEKMLGDEIKLRFTTNLKSQTPEDIETTKYLNTLITTLTKDSKKPFEYQVFLDNGCPPNACAMPGGVICVTTGLMKILENEAELVAILGHEVGHIERGHLFDAARGEMLRRKVQETTIITFATDILHSITELGFSKTQEDEADEFGFRVLVNQGYDPIAMSTSFEKLIDYYSVQRSVTNPFDDFIATHPHTELRAEKFRSRAQLWKESHPDARWHLGKEYFQNRITWNTDHSKL